MKKNIIWLAALIAMIIAIALSFGVFSESEAQIISLCFILFVSAFLLVRNLENEGMRTILFMAEPCLTGICKAFSKTEFASFVSQLYNNIIDSLCNKIGIDSPNNIGNETALIVLFWIFFIIILVFYGQDRTAIGIHKGNENPIFREKNFSEKSMAFCNALRQRLETLNRETDWNENLFTPIEAEVEVNVKGRRKKKYSDLLKCLKKTKHGADVFLVLGDPGAGKSVSLRKLCLELLDESKKTKKIPVYINLKKWNKNWNINKLPNKNDLIEFVKEELYENGDFFTDGFLNGYFDSMLEDGRWYFIFDSFDEMPCLMGKQHCQELIDHISEILFQFMTGNNQSGGVVASRLYKAPSEAIRPTIILRIQEFNDIKIQTMLEKYLNNADEIVKELFGKREDLVVLCRNPFYLTLLINFIKEKGIVFPKNQMDLYSNFVDGRLNKCAGKIESEDFSKEDVHKAAKRLAAFFQESPKYGLECPIYELYQQSNGLFKEYWQKAIKILEYAKICRFGGINGSVSFVHRRFQEFFLVESIMEQHQDIGDDEYNGIINGSGMRDALVLYCEVTNDAKAYEIARYCWDVIKNNISYRNSILNKGSIELVNTLNFMSEAFRNRQNILSDFIKEFEQLIIESINDDTDFVILIAFTNSMVLFDQQNMHDAILKIFSLKNRWLNDLILQNCRLIHKLENRVETRFSTYFFTMKMTTFLKRYKNTHFSLSISKSFRYVKIVHLCIFMKYISMMVTVGVSAIILLTKLIDSSWSIQKTVTPLHIVNFYDDILNYATKIIFIIYIITHHHIYRQGKYVDNIFFIISSIFFPGIVMFGILLNAPEWSVVIYLAIILCVISFNAAQLIIFVHDFYYLFKKIVINLSKGCTSFTKLLNQFILYIKLLKQRVFLINFIKLICSIAITIAFWVIFKNYKDLFGIIFALICIVAAAVTPIHLVCYFVHYCQDGYWVKHRPSIQLIKREDLAKNLSALHFAKWKYLYVEKLLQNKTKLEGDWPNGCRPGQEDDNLENILAKLDCLSLEIIHRIF
ncbi:MAG: hypothetical protein J1F11_00550 [Oscillospiraceae bacterium]|nr:hypothetical protein [Oscillospiraceae bacterium]